MLVRYRVAMWISRVARMNVWESARVCRLILIGTLLPLLAACSTLLPQSTTAIGTAAPSGTGAVPAGKQSSDAAAAPASVAPESDGVMEQTRESVRSTAEWLARGVDSWFGDLPFEKGGRVTEGRLDFGVLTRETEGTDVTLRFNARFRLPNVERQAYAFVGRDNQREVIADIPGALTRQQRLLEDRPEDRSFFAGLGLPLTDAFDFRLGFRGGLKPYGQVRYRRPWRLNERDLVEFRETLFWSLKDHFGSTTALSFERAISSTLAVRWLNAATITQQSKNYEWSSLLGAYKGFGGQRLLALEALISGKQGTGVTVGDYGVQTRWEQPVYKDWLLGEIIVGHFWPRKDAASEREKSWALGGYLKMRF